MTQRPPIFLFLEPFVLLATAMAAMLLLLSVKIRRRAGKGALALQCAAIPCIAVAVLMPSIGPAALLLFFGISLIAIMKMQGS
ncbi:MAG TPA: hypothetical protein PLI21_00320 [Methanomassiliicoccaceae archaeon]|jgi:hypothetical protein|nr:hypothetical protein [Euryarchaeota archaeon]HOB37988.1 hypothetical protein [Methanomassiliicoccaceae archaeon]HOK27453.1 hypothetical protein [Methanomassiliicoccaceae archaeon]HOL07046.1 hypothetical protein [Methanomassiliicoccaceae archaeon]HOQ26431.1 hypothetical protein [Methanomassiliicoccaceae archaeon]